MPQVVDVYTRNESQDFSSANVIQCLNQIFFPRKFQMPKYEKEDNEKVLEVLEMQSRSKHVKNCDNCFWKQQRGLGIAHR